MDETRLELKLLREQLTDDLTTTWKVMGEMNDRLTERLQQLTAEMSEGFRQCQGRLRLVEQRLGTFLGVVERDLATKASRAELDALEQRVRLLEDRLTA